MTPTTRSMRPKTTKKTGTNPARRVFLALLLPAAVLGADKKKPEKKLAAVIAGTVFRDPGFAVGGAEIEMVEIRAGSKKPKARKTLTDARGEFAFSVPPIEQKYRVKATAKGLQPDEKETASTPGARVDVFFTLKLATP